MLPSRTKAIAGLLRQSVPSLDLQALEREIQRAARRDAPGREAPLAVALVRRDQELALLPHLHPEAALVPVGDDLAYSGLVREGLLARILGAPELLSGFLYDTRGMDRGCAPFGH